MSDHIFHDGCEMCGKFGRISYTEKIGYYCEDCLEEKAEQEEKLAGVYGHI